MVTQAPPKATPKIRSLFAELALVEIEIAELRIGIELATDSHQADQLLVPLFRLFRRRLDIREAMA